MALLKFLSFRSLISVMQCEDTSLMDISEDLLNESLSLVLASELNVSLLSR